MNPSSTVTVATAVGDCMKAPSTPAPNGRASPEAVDMALGLSRCSARE
jgi:hypothetical protein